MSKRAFQPMLGRRFGKLVVVATERVEGTKYVAVCACDCGSSQIRVAYQHLRDRKRSCGCDHSPTTSTALDGTRRTIAEIATLTGLHTETVRKRLRLGVPLTRTRRTAIGQRKGVLVVVRVERVKGSRVYVARCACDAEVRIYASRWATQNVTSCGCQDVAAVPPPCPGIGRVFGRLTVVGYGARRGSRGTRYWLCSCSCGGQRETLPQNLINGATKSCGCLRRGIDRGGRRRASDLTGQTFGLLTVDAFARRTKKHLLWSCTCRCGKTRVVMGASLRTGVVDRCTVCQRKATPRKPGGRLVQFRGRTMHTTEVAKELGCTMNWLNTAIRKGKPLDAIDRGHARTRRLLLPLHGAMVTVADIAAISGLKHGTVGFRLRAGMTPEDIVARPLKPGDSLKNFTCPPHADAIHADS